MIALLLAALIALLPPMKPAVRRCVSARYAAIVAAAEDAGRENDVPPSLLLTVGLLESHYGCARRSGGNWGAPIADGVAVSPRSAAGAAAASLSMGFRGGPRRPRFAGCGTWLGALSWFRCGRCRCPRRPELGYSAAYAARLAERAHGSVGTDPPSPMRRGDDR